MRKYNPGVRIIRADDKHLVYGGELSCPAAKLYELSGGTNYVFASRCPLQLLTTTQSQNRS